MNFIPKMIRRRFVRFVAARSDSCLAVTRAMSDSLERQLTIRERISVRMHSLICDACVNYLDQIKLIRNGARARTESESQDGPGLDEKARQRISNAIRRK